MIRKIINIQIQNTKTKPPCLGKFYFLLNTFFVINEHHLNELLKLDSTFQFEY